ncbi:MAG: OsmC family protein [Thermoanaerobaculia bacterium]
MEITFPGGVAVEAHHRNHTVRTDQPAVAGGADSAMAPFDLFLASIGTCMGYYAVQFCLQREIPIEGLRLSVEPLRDPERKRVATLRIDLQLPEGFPEKYRSAILRAVDQCAVKRHILEPPEFEISLHDSGQAA